MVETESAEPEEAPDEVTLSNGVRLKLQSVPPILIRQASINGLDRPRPPKYSANGHQEDNPWHPDYQAALKAYEQESAYQGVVTLVTRGIKEILVIPDGMQRPEDEEWLTDLTDDGIEVDISTDKRRRRSWLHYVALENNEDIALVQVAVARLGGIQDAEVDAAVATFRNRASRRADRSRPG